MIRKDSISFLELALHGHRVGFVAGYKSGRNVLIFAPEFRENSRRPTFSLKHKQSLREHWRNLHDDFRI